MPGPVKSPPRRRSMRDLLRLVHVRDVFYQMGNLLYRRSLRYTALTALIALAGYGANFLGVTGFTVKQAVTLPLVVGAATLLGGLVLKLVPAVIAARQRIIAQASDLNLMEDYRKAQMDVHLDAFWERIYRHEGIARDDFLARAAEAIAAPLPQTRQRYRYGLDLHLLEDWYDGAFFDRTDRKLVQQYEGSVSLDKARCLTGYSRLASVADFPARLAQKLWFQLSTRAVALHVANTVAQLNAEWDTDDFNAQVLLWPGEEDADWLARYPGARETVLERRARFIERAFGRREARTRQMLDRLFGVNYRLATRLRLRFDAEYVLGQLGHTVEDDLDELAWRRRDGLRRFAAQYTARVRPRLERFADALDAEAPDAPETVRRAALLRFHHEANRPRKRGAAVPESDAAPDVAACLAQAEEASERLAHLLVLVRQHHELARLERLGYLQLIESLRASTRG